MNTSNVKLACQVPDIQSRRFQLLLRDEVAHPLRRSGVEVELEVAGQSHDQILRHVPGGPEDCDRHRPSSRILACTSGWVGRCHDQN